MYGMRVTHKGLGARAGLLALALVVGAGLMTAPVYAQDKDKKAAPAAKPAAPAKPAAGAAPAPAGGASNTAGTTANSVAKLADNSDQSAWVKLCEKAPNITDPKKEMNVCLTFHELLDRNSGMVLVSAAIRQVEGQDKKALMVMVPLGMALPPGVQVKVDEGEPVKLQFTLCHAAGCTAEGEATQAVIDQMSKGKQVVVAAINLAGKAIGFPVPLTGFPATYAGKPVDNEKYKEARKRVMVEIYDRQKEMVKKAQEEAAAKKNEPATKKQ